jgi:hypothetical protein
MQFTLKRKMCGLQFEEKTLDIQTSVWPRI